MKRPCYCNDLPPDNQKYTTEYCRLCWLFYNDIRYFQMWGGEEEKKHTERGEDGLTKARHKVTEWKKRLRSSCKYRGSLTGESKDCTICGGKVNSVPLYFCSLFQKCTAGTIPLAGISHCATCSKYEPILSIPVVSTIVDTA